MAKRRSNVYASLKTSSDSEINYSDSEDDTYEPGTKKICTSRLKPKRFLVKTGKQLSYPKEENEHTYCSTPIFSNVSRKRNISNGSSGSDCENYELRSTCISERSSSIDSVKYNGIPSDVDVERIVSTKRKPKCHSKNAVMARMNRQRKKEYVEKLEGDITCLKKNNNDMKSKLKEQENLIAELKSQIGYLRSTLANSKEIGSILRKVCGNTTDSKLTSSLVTSLPSSDANLLSDCNFQDIGDWMSAIDTVEDFDKAELPKASLAETDVNDPLDSVGVCVHVSKNQVSFEFCERCNHNASHGILNDNGLPMVN